MKIFICQNCGKKFPAPACRKAKYCGMSCYGIASKSKKITDEHKKKISIANSGVCRMSSASRIKMGKLAKSRFTKNYCEYYPPIKCGCGCGKNTNRANRSYPHLGLKKYQPFEYLVGHQTKKKWIKGAYAQRGDSWKKNISKARIKSGSARGKNNPNWQGGLTNLQHSIRNIYLYKDWRKKVYTRDNYTCVSCGQAGTGRNLNADHIIPLSLLIRELKIKSLDDAIVNSYIWNVENGRTLCVECHKKTDSYGWNATNNYLRKGLIYG